MKILKCSITNFGCYSNKTFDFTQNLNSFCLNNGEGKTTLAMFIKAMFYSLEKSSKTSYERKHYKPYAGGEYGGSMIIELDGVNYRIERIFNGETATKDTLKIYDGQGIELKTFLSKQVSELQGEKSIELGELILGINYSSFLRCNFISSDDLDFHADESIKMKIGNIVIDKEKENTYEDTCKAIKDFDLRDKKPTKKNENAYPYKIGELKKENKQKQNDINQLNQLEENLKTLYDERNSINEELKKIKEKQSEYSSTKFKIGQLSTVEEYDREIEENQKCVGDLTQKYNGNLPADEKVNLIENCLSNYGIIMFSVSNNPISNLEIARLKEIEGKVIKEDDYDKLYDANAHLKNISSTSGVTPVDLNRYEQLCKKFEGRKEIIKNDTALEEEYGDYRKLESDVKNFDNNFHIDIKDNLPSENVLNHIDSRIKEYNESVQTLKNMEASYKEPSIFVKIILKIITLGIYILILNSKKTEHNKVIKYKKDSINKIKNELDSFFIKYNKTIGSYDRRMAELKDDIKKQESSKSKNEEYTKLKETKTKQLEDKRNELLNYFLLFGYGLPDIRDSYNKYKEELQEYGHLSHDVNRNNDFERQNQNKAKEQNEIINAILKKYDIPREDNFSRQLEQIKSNIEFYKEWNPKLIDKNKNDNLKNDYKKQITSILDEYEIQYNDDNFKHRADEVVEDKNKYKASIGRIKEIEDKRTKFIKDNDLVGFTIQNTEEDEEKLNQEISTKTNELKKKEDEIRQNEDNIERRENLQKEIDENNEKIIEYEKRIKIAELALKALEDAHSEMDNKYISPIRNSFITYAKKIYEKIGSSDVEMNYDYEIKYPIMGQLRNAKDLSDGERTIMMLALRFAILDSMYPKHDSVIVLDDPFESLDPDKLVKAKDLIIELSKEWQLVYFTCHNSRKIECE